jgi:hypothetical protein
VEDLIDGGVSIFFRRYRRKTEQYFPCVKEMENVGFFLAVKDLCTDGKILAGNYYPELRLWLKVRVTKLGS